MACFWNGAGFPKDFHSQKLSLYPQLLSYDWANAHSNIGDGYVYKINCYNGLTDQLQVDFSQRPIERMNLCKELFDKLGLYQSDEIFFESAMKMKRATQKKLEALNKNVKKLFASESITSSLVT